MDDQDRNAALRELERDGLALYNCSKDLKSDRILVVSAQMITRHDYSKETIIRHDYSA